MHLLPSRIKTKYRPYKQFYNMLRLPKLSLSIEDASSNRLISGGRGTWTIWDSNPSLRKLTHAHCTFFANALMISQNIKFKPIYKRSKTFTLPLWVANPLRLYNRLRTKVSIWLNLLQ